jgi:hypothetical protein
MALEAQRKDKERKEGRSKQRTEEIHDTENRKGVFFMRRHRWFLSHRTQT